MDWIKPPFEQCHCFSWGSMLYMERSFWVLAVQCNFIPVLLVNLGEAQYRKSNAWSFLRPTSHKALIDYEKHSWVFLAWLGILIDTSPSKPSIHKSPDKSDYPCKSLLHLSIVYSRHIIHCLPIVSLDFIWSELAIIPFYSCHSERFEIGIVNWKKKTKKIDETKKEKQNHCFVAFAENINHK